MRRRSALLTIAASGLCLLLPGLHAACSSSEDYVIQIGYKRCDIDKHDSDCIDLPGSYCHAELGWCQCLNQDGTMPADARDADQILCYGECKPITECPPFDDGGVGAEATEPECVTAADCQRPDYFTCGEMACTEGRCVIDEASLPALVKSQVKGDCHQAICHGLGFAVPFEDPSDYYDDGRPCTADMCVSGMPVNVPLESPCADGYCYLGECVECVSHQDCKGGQLCESSKCVPETCQNGALDPGESEHDCGGPCAPCKKGALCVNAADCTSGVCTGGVCQLSTCSDGVLNGGETDLDCGGPCGACADDQRCVHRDKDCVSGVCWMGTCQAPSCTDGVQNGSETGTDCGGSCDPCLSSP